MNTKVREALDSIVAAFQSGAVAEAMAHTTIQRAACDAPPPMVKWSTGNRVLAMLHGTADARGFRQWGEVKRAVKKGSKAIYILAPSLFEKVTTDAAGAEHKDEVLYFRPVPVFRFEDTEGEDLPRVEYRPERLPPLIEVAERWGVPVRWAPFEGRCYGFFAHRENAITLCTHDEDTFYHELAHAAHGRVLAREGKALKSGQDSKQETVAELSACVLARLHGQRCEGRAYQYIAGYAHNGNVGSRVLSVLKDTEAVLTEIMGL